MLKKSSFCKYIAKVSRIYTLRVLMFGSRDQARDGASTVRKIPGLDPSLVQPDNERKTTVSEGCLYPPATVGRNHDNLEREILESPPLLLALTRPAAMSEFHRCQGCIQGPVRVGIFRSFCKNEQIAASTSGRINFHVNDFMFWK